MFTLDLMCMQYLCVSVIHRTMTRTTGSLTCAHYLLMHAYTHVFAFIYSVRLSGCLFPVGGGGEGLGAPFFHFGGPSGPLLWNSRSNSDIMSSLGYWFSPLPYVSNGQRFIQMNKLAGSEREWSNVPEPYLWAAPPYPTFRRLLSSLWKHGLYVHRNH